MNGEINEKSNPLEVKMKAIQDDIKYTLGWNEGYKAGKEEAVRHGEWEVLWKEKKPYILQCSECGVISDKLSHFCSYCGAKMDGKENEDGEIH